MGGAWVARVDLRVDLLGCRGGVESGRRLTATASVGRVAPGPTHEPARMAPRPAGDDAVEQVGAILAS